MTILVVLLLIAFVAAGVPWFLHARKVAQKNACLNNLRMIESGSMSYCLANRASYSDTFTLEQFKQICAYVKGGAPPVCPVINQPCIPVPYSVYEGVKCPCGQSLTPFDSPGTPWDGDFRSYYTALQQDLRPAGMRLGSDALLRLTPLMFNSVVIRDFILSHLEQWYTNVWNTDLIASAATALGNIKDPRAVDTLIKGLSCDDWYARKKIVEALGNIGDNRAAEHLKPLLEDKDERVKKAAASALAKLQK
jgi:hypothetical protein